MERRTIAERFWPKVDIRGPDECWPWLASLHSAGYGQVGFRNPDTDKWRMRPAHQVAYELQIGPIPPGRHVLHSCDNRPCCNGRHLRLGSHAENMRDAAERNRMPKGDANPARVHRDKLIAGIRRRDPACYVRGEQHGRATLTESQARDILRRVRAGEPKQALAGEFGVTWWTINNIGKGASWGHLSIGDV